MYCVVVVVWSDLLVADSPQSCVCRDELLSQLGGLVDGGQGVESWGAACNRAVRECFPDSGLIRRMRRISERSQVKPGGVNRYPSCVSTAVAPAHSESSYFNMAV